LGRRGRLRCLRGSQTRIREAQRDADCQHN
jgi:hypothetical protein